MNRLNTVALILLLAAPAVYAEEDMGGSKQQPTGDRFASLDVNEDGVLDKSEAKGDTELANNWAAIDIDRDGLVSPDELTIYTGEATAAGADTEGEILNEPVPE